MMWRHGFVVIAVGLATWANAGLIRAANNKPTAADALSLAPVQDDVDYDKPEGAAKEKCRIEADGPKGQAGWVVKNDQGVVIRRFLDTNGDNKVDQWCYYKDGVEVYRDIDSNFNGKADQSRWLGPAGTRWGIDKDEDGRIDYWKVISAEEVTMEAVAALRTHDQQRLKRLLITTAELKELGLGADKTEQIAKKIGAASSLITQVATKKELLSEKAQWLHFVALTPGTLPAGTLGSTKDVTAYQNVFAVVSDQGKTQQLPLGTLVKIGDAWRMLDLPDDSDPTSLFGDARNTGRNDAAPNGSGTGPSEEDQKLIKLLEQIDQQLASASPEKAAKLNEQRADIFEKLAIAAKAEDRVNWIHQLADSIAAAVQANTYPDGPARLKSLFERISKGDPKSDLAAYVKFRLLQANYAQSLNTQKDFAKVQEQWLKELERFVSDFPKAPDAAEALLQLAMAQEFAGKDEDARKLYLQIATSFPTMPLAEKAKGAKRRLESEGKTVELQGTSVDGRKVSLASLKGKTVLVHYWATWCQPCKQDMDTIARLQSQYGKQGFEVIGINLDADEADAKQYLAQTKLPWPHLYEKGGLDSRLAVEMGVVTLPTMLLIDKDGKVADRKIQAANLETELGRLFKKAGDGDAKN